MTDLEEIFISPEDYDKHLDALIEWMKEEYPGHVYREMVCTNLKYAGELHRAKTEKSALPSKYEILEWCGQKTIKVDSVYLPNLIKRVLEKWGNCGG